MQLGTVEDFYVRHTVDKLNKLPADDIAAADQLLLDLLGVLDLHQVVEAYEQYLAKASFRSGR